MAAPHQIARGTGPGHLALALLCATLAFAQQKDRNLIVERLDAPAPMPGGKPIPRSYAVIVGIAAYKNLPPEKQLAFTERDAQSIFTILISPEGGNFKVENVHILAGGRATLAGLRHEINEWLPSVAKEDDRVLIYFAGHGFMFQGKGYLAPYDFDEKRIAATGYPMDELGSVFGSKIKAQSKILLTDACHSGAIAPSEMETFNRTMGSLQKSLFSLTASRASEQSFEDPTLQGGHGVFTYYVVSGMGGQADADGDGVVTADELSEYVHTQVRDYTKAAQNPTSDKTNYDPTMLLAYIPSNAKPAEVPVSKFGGMVIESNRDEVEVFIDGVWYWQLNVNRGDQGSVQVWADCYQYYQAPQ